MTRLQTNVIAMAFLLTLLFSTNNNVQALPATPNSASAWINSKPISLDSLKGKIVVLYFYEES